MADKFTISTQIQLDRTTAGGIKKDVIQEPNQTLAQATDGKYEETLTRTTSDVVLSFGNLTEPNLVWFKNMDTTNFIDIGPTAAGVIVPSLRLAPGAERWMTLTPGQTWRTQADTASVRLWIIAYET